MIVTVAGARAVAGDGPRVPRHVRRHRERLAAEGCLLLLLLLLIMMILL